MEIELVGRKMARVAVESDHSERQVAAKRGLPGLDWLDQEAASAGAVVPDGQRLAVLSLGQIVDTAGGRFRGSVVPRNQAGGNAETLVSPGLDGADLAKHKQHRNHEIDE